MEDMTKKKPTGLRLDQETIERLDKALDVYYAPLPVPSRNSVLEAWVNAGLKELEDLVQQKEGKSQGKELTLPSRVLPKPS